MPWSGSVDLATAPASRTECAPDEVLAGAALAAPSRLIPSRVYALLPNHAENAFLPLLRNCARVDVVLTEWHEITGASLAVARADVDAEMEQSLAAILDARGGQTEAWPVIGFGTTLTAAEFLDGAGGPMPGQD